MDKLIITAALTDGVTLPSTGFEEWSSMEVQQSPKKLLSYLIEWTKNWEKRD